MKNILIAVSGLTPQIITEAFYCLTIMKKIPIDEIYVLTTSRGRNVILGVDENPNTPKSPLMKEIKTLCEKYKLEIPLFENNDTHIITAKEESVELYDVRSDKQNKLYPNKIAEFIKKKTSEFDTSLYCVISGGRKSMSVHLAFAISIFGRENDKLLHVLTSEENEFKGFYPVNKKEHSALELSEIPYVRLRSLIMSERNYTQILNKNFIDIVEFTQKKLIKISDKKLMFVDIEKRSLTYDSYTIQLEPLEFAIYYLFINNNFFSSHKPFSINYISSAAYGVKLLDFIKETYSYYYIDEKKEEMWNKNGLDPAVFRTKRSNINKKLKLLFTDSDLFDQFQISSIKKHYETPYFIKASKDKFKISFI